MLALRKIIFFKDRLEKKLLFEIIFLIFCFIYQLPQLSLFEIEQRNQTTNYTTKFVASDKSFLKRNLLAMQRLVRLVLCFIIIFLLFKLSKISFKKYEAFQLRITNNMQVSTRKRENSSFKKSKLSILLTRPFYFLFLINLLLKRQIDFYWKLEETLQKWSFIQVWYSWSEIFWAPLFTCAQLCLASNFIIHFLSFFH